MLTLNQALRFLCLIVSREEIREKGNEEVREVKAKSPALKIVTRAEE